VTLKTRTGWSPQTRNLPRIARLARDAGIAMLTVHGRTRACGYSGAAEHDSLRALRAETDLPLVVNGDIDSPERARAALDYTGADAMMIGRAAQGRPWIFAAIGHYLATGRLIPEPAPAEIGQLLLEHLDALYSFYGTRRGMLIARKHIGWYCRRPHGDARRAELFRSRLVRADSVQEQTALVSDYFQGPAKQEEAA
jgi:tRNA-dihydrouridine synthase B